MERRRAIAWAGSIAATGCAATLAVGALVGGFGLRPGPEGDGPVASPGPVPGVPEPGPVPGVPHPGPVPEVTEPEPAPEVPQPRPVPGVPAPGPVPRAPGPVPREPESLPVLGGAPVAGRDLRSPSGGGMRHLAAPTTGPSVNTSEVPSRAAKVGSRPEPTPRSSLQREPATMPSEVGTSKQGRGARGHDQREPAATPSTADIPGLLTPQSKAPARDQPPDSNAKPTKENRAVPNEDGGGG